MFRKNYIRGKAQKEQSGDKVMRYFGHVQKTGSGYKWIT